MKDQEIKRRNRKREKGKKGRKESQRQRDKEKEKKEKKCAKRIKLAEVMSAFGEVFLENNQLERAICLHHLLLLLTNFSTEIHFILLFLCEKRMPIKKNLKIEVSRLCFYMLKCFFTETLFISFDKHFSPRNTTD